MLACCDDRAHAESERRAHELQEWRADLTDGLAQQGIPVVIGSAPFVLARPGRGVHGALRERGIAVRRADTFPGLDDSWIRIAARDAAMRDRLLYALADIRQPLGAAR